MELSPYCPTLHTLIRLLASGRVRVVGLGGPMGTHRADDSDGRRDAGLAGEVGRSGDDEYLLLDSGYTRYIDSPTNAGADRQVLPTSKPTRREDVTIATWVDSHTGNWSKPSAGVRQGGSHRVLVIRKS